MSTKSVYVFFSNRSQSSLFQFIIYVYTDNKQMFWSFLSIRILLKDYDIYYIFYSTWTSDDSLNTLSIVYGAIAVY